MNKKAKKVLIFSTAYFPFVGGAEVAVKEITDRLSPEAADGKPQIKFDMITARMDRKLPKTELVGNVNVYRIGCGWGVIDKFRLPLCGLVKALKLQRENNYDIAWPIMASQASIAAAFLKIFKPQIKLLLTLQEGDEEEHLKRYVFGSNLLYKIFIQQWHLLVFKKADYVTVISNYLKERALKNRVRCKVEVVPNGVDLEKFQISNNKLQTNFKFQISNLKKELGIKEDEKMVITTSRLVKKNGIDDLIRAMPKLQIIPQPNKFGAGQTNYKLLILGTGPDEEKLKQLAKELKTEDRVLFLGQVNQKELPKYLQASDVFCRPSLSEGLGNSFLEAMAAGAPVIGTSVGGIPDFLIDGKTGWFCKVKDPESIAEKINYILDEKNKDEVRRVVQNARKMVEEKYNWDNIAIKFKEIFNENL